MCGISGVFFRDPHAIVKPSVMVRMTESLSHRGPDDGGIALFGPAALGHRRLSILDLSPAGHQPMASADERYFITFNGEIYNFQELRSELERGGASFRTRTDTEVLLELYRTTGRDCVKKLNGMFAFAIYDRWEHQLFLARDRLGKKPLYIWDTGDMVAFGSELKAIMAHPAFSPRIDYRAMLDYLAVLYVPDPRSIFEGVQKLEPAHTLEISTTSTQRSCYWQPPTPESGRDRFRSVDEANDAFGALLTDAVKSRMMSDVPLGAFLSGGVDSSLVVSEMQRLDTNPVKTCAIGFDVAHENEAPFAEAIAGTLGCDHRTDYVSLGHDQAITADTVTSIMRHFDEPFGDASAVPTWLLSQVTRKRVTVALSGDGGDEGFAGYEKYFMDRRERNLRSRIPMPLRKYLERVGQFADIYGPPLFPRAGGALLTLAGSEDAGYFRTNAFVRPEHLRRLLSQDMGQLIDAYDPGERTRALYRRFLADDRIGTAQCVDIMSFLPGDILTKVDRMSMAHGLEVRCPLLDHRIVEFGLSLPQSFRIEGNSGKQPLKALLRNRIGSALVDRPKHGFTSPVDEWFRGPLLAQFRDHVGYGRIQQDGVLHMPQIEQLVREHRSGRFNHGMTLWTLMMLGGWYDTIYTANMEGQELRPAVGVPATIVDYSDQTTSYDISIVSFRNESGKYGPRRPTAHYSHS